MANPNSPRFPTNIPTDNDLGVMSNRSLSVLTASITATDSSIPVQDGSRYQTPCFVQIDNEIVLAQNKVGNVLTSCLRGQSGSNATVHASGAYARGYIFAHHHNQLAAEIKAICLGLGPNLGNVVLQTDSAGGEITGVFSSLHLGPNGIVPGPYGAADKTPIITVDAAGRVSSIGLITAAGSGVRVMNVDYKAAIVQGTNAVLGFSFALGQAPAATIIAGPNQHYGVATFTQGNNYWVQDHFMLPDDWTGNIDLDIFWLSSATTGSVTWECECAGFGNGSLSNNNWLLKSTITDLAQSPTLSINKTRMTLNTPSVNPGDELMFKFGRSATDSLAADAHLLSMRFVVRRQWNNGLTAV